LKDPPKFTQIWIFWFENMPSGNPEFDQITAETVSLNRLQLGRCAPEASVIAQGKNDSLRARAILRSLVPLEDLEGVLSLRFQVGILESN
jgi:ryanodine receptor 2